MHLGQSSVSEPLRRPSVLAMAMFVVAGLAATYLLPYLVPVQASVSDSYLAGFNNHASFLIFVVFAGLFAWWTGSLGLRAPGSPLGQNSRPSSRSLFYTLAYFVLVTVLLWLAVRSHLAFEEGPYFLDRLHHLERGEIPYRQFDFDYGPLLLYGPYAIAKLFHLQIGDGYHLAWILEFLLGVLLIYASVSALPARGDRKTVIFLLLAWTWWPSPLNFGQNYTPFRFFAAPFLCILASRYIRTSKATLKTLVALLLAEIALFLVSPEQAIAFSLATGLFLFCDAFVSRSLSRLPLIIQFVIGSGLIFAAAERLGLLLAVHFMSHGGYNIPLLPALQHIPLFGGLLVAACILVASLRSRRPLGPLEYLVLFGLAILPAAFGRTDPGHVIINTAGALLVAFVVLSHHHRLWRYAVVSYVFCILIFPAPKALRVGQRQVRNGIRSTPFAPGSETANRAPSSPADTRYASAPRLLAPLTLPVMNSGQFPSLAADTGYYYGLEDVVSPPQVEQKVAELRNAPEKALLVPTEFSCTSKLDRKVLRGRVMTLYVPPARHSIATLQPLCDYIAQHYVSSGDPTPLLGYEILKRTPTPPQP